MKDTLSQEITPFAVLKFTMPTIIMMIFMSLYTIVDGIFVSRLVGTDALSAVNIVYPFLSFVLAVAIMLGTGASAVIARKLGEGKKKEANQNFTLIIIIGIILGLLILVITLLFLKQFIYMLGANEQLFDYCYDYMIVLLFFFPASVLQLLFQFLFVTAGKPNIGLAATILGGIANIVLDYVFIAVFDMGIAGAAVATGIGYCIPAVIGLIYFSMNKKGGLHFVKPVLDTRMLFYSCLNGSSEMVSNLSTAVITFLFNIVMMRYLGPDGVAAITIVLYAEFVLTAIYLGYSSGVAPLISYNYGSGDGDKLKKLFRLSLSIIGISSIMMISLSLASAKGVVRVFASPDSPVYALAVRGFYLYSIAFLFKGANIFASALFTAFSDGRVSALLSFMRTLVFIVVSIVILTLLFEVDGVWLSVPVAEILSIFMSGFYIVRKRKKYHYI